MAGLAAVKYTLYVQKRYGPGIVEELLAIKHSKNYLKRAELEAIIEKYKTTGETAPSDLELAA
jgi:hypothetical protein